jgi:hypothetical protein
MRLIGLGLLVVAGLLGLAACAGTNATAGITTNQDAYAAEKPR